MIVEVGLSQRRKEEEEGEKRRKEVPVRLNRPLPLLTLQQGRKRRRGFLGSS